MYGWIKLHRSFRDHWLYKEKRPHTKREAWEDILLLANHENEKVLVHGELIQCNRGQLVYALGTLAYEFNWSIQNVRTFLKLLSDDEMISVEGLRKTTRITICNYGFYQDSQHTTNTQLTDRNETNTDESEKDKQTNESEEILKSTQVQVCESNDYENVQQTNNKQTTDKTTNKQQTNNNQITTNKKVKNKDNIPPEGGYTVKNKFVSYDDLEKMTKFFYDQQSKINEIALKSMDKTRYILNGIESLDKCIYLDGLKLDDLKSILRYVIESDFWQNNLISLASIRNKGKNGMKKWVNIVSSMKSNNKNIESDSIYKQEKFKPKNG